MTFVITQRCCSDTSCISECPVDCIRPRPEDPEFQTAEMLFIDPDTCIDCGACADACPVDAIYSEFDVPEEMGRYVGLNAAYFERHPLDSSMDGMALGRRRLPESLGTLRVAIVGAGPAACYAAEELLSLGKVEVEIFDKVSAPWGLVRTGVAPDHQETKGVANMFATAFRSEAVNFHLNVEVGKHVSLAELLEHHHAVIYAVGAASDRRLGIPGEELPGSHSATEFVAWYNGHPDHAAGEFDLSGERAVIVGNGNVALDVARILTVDPDQLARTDIADHALTALRESNIREVVVLGRRGPVQAAYSTSEFLALGYLDGVDVVIDESEMVLDETSQAVLDDPEVEPSLTLKMEIAREYADRPVTDGNRRIVFRYLVAPTELHGTDRVSSLEYVRNTIDENLNAVATDETGSIETSLVLRSVGYRGAPVADVPFDEARAVIRNDRGRVEGLSGVYTTGWIKRGPRGVIGTNRADSAETIAMLIEDFEAGQLTAPTGSRSALSALIAERQPELVDKTRWGVIDAAEKAAGTPLGRPRVKFLSIEELRATVK
jgi:ferredoxin/flavodoxin---NADP+ reductase